jgi:hypothetical protein
MLIWFQKCVCGGGGGSKLIYIFRVSLPKKGLPNFHRDHYSGVYIYIIIIIGTTIKGILTNRHVTTRLLQILTKQATSVFKILTY